jgi:hypothetical protein
VTGSRLPREVRKLFESGVNSIEKIEALRCLRRSGGSVTRTELMRTLRLEREATDALVGELEVAGLVELASERGHLRLITNGADAAYDDLIRLYDEDRLLVVSALSALAVERIRTMAARAFGEALVSKKKPNQDNGDH